MNSFGEHWVFTSFGESHSAAIGGVLDGVPAGMHIDFAMIREALNRRAGKQQVGVSPRAVREADEVEWLSGVIGANGEAAKDSSELITLGTPIAFLIRNRDARPEDYEALKHSFRQGHADFTYQAKYGVRDYRGGGRASARETAARVVAGNIAAQHLAQQGIHIQARLIRVGDETRPEHFDELIARYRAEGDSIGGIIACEVTGLPIGLGEPIFDKLQAHLAFAILSINACKGFDYGSGFEGVSQPGSVANLRSGGLLGGITDGTPLTFRCVFKPTPTTPKSLAQLQKEQLNAQMENAQMANGKIVNRSDTCIAVRAVPVVEAMTALVLADFVM